MLGVVAGIAGNQVQAGDRYIKFGAAGVLKHQKFAGLTLNGDGFQATVAANAMVNVDHGRADPQFRQVPETGIVSFCRLFPATPLQNPLSEEGCFGNQRNGVLRKHQAVFHRSNGNGQWALLVVKKGLPTG